MLFTKCFFFGKGLHCKLMTVFDALHQVHWCEVPSSYFLDRLELLVKAHLVKVWLQNILPQFVVIIDQFKWSWGLGSGEGDCLISDYESEIESKREKLRVPGYARIIDDDLLVLWAGIWSPERRQKRSSSWVGLICCDDICFHLLDFSSKYYKYASLVIPELKTLQLLS